MNEKIMIMSPNGELDHDHHQDLDDHKDDDDDDDELFTIEFNNIIGSSVSEIEEIGSDEEQQQQQQRLMMRIKHNNRIPATIKEELFEGNSSVISSDGHGGARNIYVAVGKSNSSMDALRWTLKNLLIIANNPSAAASSSSSSNTSMMIYLIHVFPEIRFIPTPMGKFHKDQASPEQVKKYMNQESEKRREFLQKFLNICSSVSKVKVETLLIESDDIAKAVIDLILILNIKKLVLGTTKSSLRKLRKANGIADQILKSASDTCDIKIICDGKEVIIDQSMINESPSSRRNSSNDFADVDQKDDRDEGSLSPCTCFTSKFI